MACENNNYGTQNVRIGLLAYSLYAVPCLHTAIPTLFLLLAMPSLHPSTFYAFFKILVYVVFICTVLLYCMLLMKTSFRHQQKYVTTEAFAGSSEHIIKHGFTKPDLHMQKTVPQDKNTKWAFKCGRVSEVPSSCL